jgi:hypothetical protein
MRAATDAVLYVLSPVTISSRFHLFGGRMAIRNSGSSARSAAAAAAGTANRGNASNRADGFVNFYLPGKSDGTKRKLGAIALSRDKPAEAQLLDWLEEDGGKHTEARTKTLLSRLIVEYNPSIPEDQVGFKLD